MGDSNIKKKGRKSKKKKPLFYPTDYWVQYQDSSPLDYSPDRNGFIAKVFSIVLFMLLITAAFVGFVRSSEAMMELFVDSGVGSLLMLAGVAGMTILSCLLMCCPYMRLFPCTLIMLIVAVVCMSLITAYITAYHKTEIIVYALITTAVTVLACLLLALTSFDFTKFLLYVFVVGIAFSVLSFLVFFASFALGIWYKPLHLALLFCGTILNVIMLIMELQMIIGGKAVSLNEDEYMFGAYMLYTSIVDLFLKMVQLFGLFLDMDFED
ncbi:hypothetical protein PYW07_010465 [Mythimna separata]|uniref:Uncharacterized protein n=1 Tax=Mythimna separata TaxID=271217 RepID=A0AAD7YAN2_MYTSE|nr:hypothetical protein PYW07_010465 [Mythimna separata]